MATHYVMQNYFLVLTASLALVGCASTRETTVANVPSPAVAGWQHAGDLDSSRTELVPMAPVARACTASELEQLNKWKVCGISTISKCDAIDCGPGHVKLAAQCKDGKSDGYPLVCPTPKK